MNMESTTSPRGEMYRALISARAAMPPLVKNKNNPHFKFWYADLDAMLGVVLPSLHAHGLCLHQGTELRGAECVLLTTIAHVSGETIQSEHPLPANAKAQDFGSAMTYARRYEIAAMLALAAEDDDDGNRASSAGPRQPPPAPVAREASSSPRPPQQASPAPTDAAAASGAKAASGGAPEPPVQHSPSRAGGMRLAAATAPEDGPLSAADLDALVAEILDAPDLPRLSAIRPRVLALPNGCAQRKLCGAAWNNQQAKMRH